MSQTRTSNRSDPAATTLQPNCLPGVTFTPEALTSREVEVAHELVRGRQLKPVGLKPLVDLFHDLGLTNQGFLGCVSVPYEELSYGFLGPKVQVKKIVPVWAIFSGDRRFPRGVTKRNVTYMNTNQFVSWLRNPERRPSNLVAIPEASGALPVEPAPAQSIYGSLGDHFIGRTAVPLPSSPEDYVPRPPSYVSQLGDIRPFEDDLSQLEAEFSSTPRVEEGRAYDNDEYFRRLDALNEGRQRRGLPVRTAPTPSTYER